MYSGEGKRINAVRSMHMVRILVKPLTGVVANCGGGRKQI